MFAQFLLAPPTLAATLTVGPDEVYTTIALALDDAVDGDLVLVAPGTYTDRLLIDVDVTLRSTDGAATTAIADGNDQLSVVKIWSNVTLDGFTVTTTDESFEHCIRVASGGTLVLRDSIVTQCTAGDGLGGGLRFDVDTKGLVLDTQFLDNEALAVITGRGAHIYSRADVLTIRRTSFADGYTEKGDGGAIYANSGILTIEDSTFLRHSTGDDGGVIAVDGLPTVNPDGTESDGVSSLVLHRNSFQESEAVGHGGVIFARDVATLDLTGNTFCSGTADGRGGAMYLEDTGGVVSNNVLLDHYAGDDGGTLYVKYDAPLVENNHILGSEAVDDGGAIAAFDVPSLVLRNDLVAWTRGGIAVFADAETTIDNHHNGFHANADGDLDGALAGLGDVTGDPSLRDWNDDGVCLNDDLRPDLTSPLLDAGALEVLDADGTPSDIGAFGGPAADPCVGAPDPRPAACTP